MRRCNDLQTLIDFMAYVVLYAPDGLARSYLKPGDQLDLTRAFNELRYGLDCVAKGTNEAGTVERCKAMLEESYAHYREGRIKEGAWLLQDMQQVLRGGQ